MAIARSGSVATLLLGLLALGPPAHAQLVGMAGEYSENASPILHLPMNPPIEDCAASEADWLAQNQARCVRREGQFFMLTSAAPVFRAPHHGVYGARLATAMTSTLPSVASPGPRPPGLNPGDPFRVPAGLMKQSLGLQFYIPPNNAIRQLDTSVHAMGPAPSRDKNPPASTRVFAANGWLGQDNGASPPVPRSAAAQTIVRTVDNETLTLTYTPGPNAFGGTMATLLDGRIRGYREIIFADFPSGFRPVVVADRFDDGLTGAKERGGPGWNYTVQDAQASGYGKAFGMLPASVLDVVLPERCPAPPATQPSGCNEVNFWETPFPGVPPTTVNPEAVSLFNGAPGLHLGFGGTNAATSTRHAFAWTTGEVRIQRVAVRSGLTITDSVTARGYDTTTTGPDGTPNRRVGLVSGAYTLRTLALSPSFQGPELDGTIVGLDLELTPEPGATVMLACAVVGLAGLAQRRRRATGPPFRHSQS